MMKNPLARAEEDDEPSTSPPTKKSSLAASEASDKRALRDEIDEEEEELEEEDDSTAYGTPFAFSSPQPPPYYPHFDNSYGWMQVPSNQMHAYAYGTQAPSKAKRRRSKSALASESKRRTTTIEHEDVDDGDEENQTEDKFEESDLEEEAPKAKRRKVASGASGRFGQSWNRQFGLQPPSFGEFPASGYRGGYGSQWWSAAPPPSPWSQQSMPHTQDNASLWAYYYYGYAMGQYETFMALSKKKK